MARKKILWLASWYPNRIDLYNGDFIQRHAQAVSLYHDVYVLFVMRVDQQAVATDNAEEVSQTNGVTEHRIYYAVKGAAVLQKLRSQWQYQQLFKNAIRRYILQNGIPDLVHVHVTLKAGMQALWMKKKWGVPYVITEHASLFLPEASETFKKLPSYLRVACARIWNGAASISVVSNYLHGHLKKLASGSEFSVIPNVVDTTIFLPKDAEVPALETRFIHVSGLGHPKKPEAILEAFAYVRQKGVPFQLHIVGPQQPALLQLMHRLNMNDVVFFHSEVPQSELALYMQQAHALVLYSRYETFGCVVIEANACGLPVIVSDIPTMRELVKPGVNGVLVDGEDITALGEKIIWFTQNRHCFDKDRIAHQAREKYNYSVVGRQFSNWYASVLEAGRKTQS
jgi:glycosyltransferase involved in cell wall biosynthesis